MNQISTGEQCPKFGGFGMWQTTPRGQSLYKNDGVQYYLSYSALKIAFEWSFLTVVILALVACAPMPEKSVSRFGHAPSTSSSKSLGYMREKLAQQHYEQGQYAQALLQWKILKIIDPNNRDYSSRINHLQSLIERKSRDQLQMGIAAFNKGDVATARRELLRILALNPGEATALEYLRRIEQDQVWRVQIAKLEKLKAQDKKDGPGGEQDREQERYYLELGIFLFREGDYSGSIREIQKYLNSYPKNSIARKYITDAYFKLAQYQQQQGQLLSAVNTLEQSQRYAVDTNPIRNKTLQDMKNALAQEYYEKGIRYQRNDLIKAIESWQAALVYNPKHPHAQVRLNEALKMQKKLQDIR